MSSTNDSPEPDDHGSDHGSTGTPGTSASRRKRRTLIITAVAITVALVSGAVVTAGLVQAQQLEQAKADADATAAAAAAAALGDAETEAGELAKTIDGVLEALAVENGEPVIDVDLEQLRQARDALDADYTDASDVRGASFAAVRELDLVLRSVLATGRATVAQVTLAGEDAVSALEDAVSSLGRAPYGTPSSYANRDQLVAAVLEAAQAARDAHEKAAIVASAPPAGGAPSTGGGSNAGGSGATGSGSATGSGGTTGGGTSGGSGGTTAPPPPPHPRAALCESLGFTNNLACLNSEPTYVATNASYLDWATCSAAGAAAYGSHTPGFGGTSRPSYTQPWSYQIVYASSGLGTVKFYLCDI